MTDFTVGQCLLVLIFGLTMYWAGGGFGERKESSSRTFFAVGMLIALLLPPLYLNIGKPKQAQEYEHIEKPFVCPKDMAKICFRLGSPVLVAGEDTYILKEKYH